MLILNDVTNESLFCPPTLKLGEIHWHLLKSAGLMTARRHEPGTYKSTEFGKEVGRDEISWWVFKKEQNIDELRQRTERALAAAEVLKKASALLRGKTYEKYDDLLTALRNLAETCATEVGILHDYVMWLYDRDPLAPTILFNYRTWGSTRMSDRWFDVTAESLQAETLKTLRFLTEIVLGLHNSHLYAMDRAYFDVEEEVYDSMGPENVPQGGVTIPMERIVSRACYRVFQDCAEYFSEIRDSVRNILIDVEKFVEQRDLIHSDAFWRGFIKKAIETKKTETALWDFKQTLTMWHVTGEKKDEAKVTFAEDVAAFANVRGGVLLVGISDLREVVGIGDARDVENRLAFARQVLDKHLEYGRQIVQLHQVVLGDSKGVQRICLAVIVAEACQVVGVDDGNGHYTYPVRRETGIARLSRSEIADPKIHMKSDNFDFIKELDQFVREN